MKKDQLFKKSPSDELLHKVLNSFGLVDLSDSRSFSRKDLKILKTVDKIYELKSELSFCYLACKARTYLNNLNEKNVITILRQVLKTRHYTIVSREKYMRGEKFIIYSISLIDKNKYIPILEYKKLTQTGNIENPITLTFD